MSVALLLVTHEQIAQSLINIVQGVLNRDCKNVAAIEIPMDAPLDEVKSSAQVKLSQLDTSDGILLLTDLMGSTPFNVARQLLSENDNAALVSGLNLPMLLKLANYRSLTLDQLAEKAIIGGQNGITLHEPNTCS